jgi:hypothetical protein
VQHEGCAHNGGSRLVRRIFHGFNVTDNLAIGPNDVTEFGVVAPGRQTAAAPSQASTT